LTTESGKYDTAHPLPEGSQRANTYNPILPQLEALTGLMDQIGAAHGVSVAQVAMAWAINKGTILLVGVTKSHHVENAVKAVGIKLTADEMVQLEEAAAKTGVDTRGSWENPMA